MSGLRAVGVRAAYPSIPASVRHWVDESLGSRVVESSEQVGGMSPGCATRVVCADGRRAFVKAVGTELNPDTPTLFRREITALRTIGGNPLWASLEAAYDDGNWVALILEDVDGQHPDLSDDPTLDQLLTDTETLSKALALVEHPEPAPEEGGLGDFARMVTRWAGFVDALVETPSAPAPAWLRDEAAGWADRVRALSNYEPGQLQHGDIRNDNLIVRPTGEMVFIDWGMSMIGPAWLDPLLARLERVDEPWFDASIASSPSLADAGDDRITTWLVGFGGMLAQRSITAVDVNLPTINEFRIRESARMLAAATRRLGFG